MSVVLISGANSGIGRLSALAFARAGHRVVAGARSVERAVELTRLAAEESLDLRVVQLDVTDAGSVGRAVEKAVEVFGPVDVLVNNAGVTAAGPVEWTDEDQARWVFETNFFGPLRLIKAVLGSMRERGSGSIVLVGSLQGCVPAPGGSIYAASKQAAAALHEALAFEVEGFGIRVSTVVIGPYHTGIQARTARSPAPAEYYDPLLAALGARQARRLAESDDPAEVAQAVLDVAFGSRPPLRIAVGKHAKEQLDGDDRAERFLRGLRAELGRDGPVLPGAGRGPGE